MWTINRNYDISMTWTHRMNQKLTCHTSWLIRKVTCGDNPDLVQKLRCQHGTVGHMLQRRILTCDVAAASCAYKKVPSRHMVVGPRLVVTWQVQ